MSTAPSSLTSPDPESRRPILNIQLPIRDTRKPSVSEHDPAVASPSRPGISRHYTTLQEHADAVRGDALTPGDGGGSTPRAEGRREGFMWEVRKNEDSLHLGPRPPPTPTTPPSMEEILRIQSKIGDDSYERGPSITSIDTVPLSRSSTTHSEYSLQSCISRTDTGRSSFSGLARGLKKHGPDMRMFLPTEKAPSTQEDTAQNPKTRQSKFDFSATPPIELPGMMKRTPAPTSEEKSPSSSHSCTASSKSSIQERRKLVIGDAMTLTLPQNMPGLPSRSRMPVGELSSIAPSRSRSPKTPWTMEHQPAWHTGPSTAPPTIFEVNTPTQVLSSDPVDSVTTPREERTNSRPRTSRSMGRVRFRRAQSSSASVLTQGSTDPTSPQITASPDELQLGRQTELRVQEQDAQAQQDLHELGKRRSRRWRWSGPWSSNDLADTPPNTPPFSLTRLLKKKHSIDSTTPNSPNTASPKSFWRRKQSIPSYSEQQRRDDEFLTKMNVPPYFIPPGLNRVPTPPMFDPNGEVKGKLEDFFFEMQGGRQHKRAQASGSIWDSDALLMSQEMNISSPTTESDESPQATALPEGSPTSSSPQATSPPSSSLANRPPVATPTSNLAAYLNIPGTPSPVHGSSPPIPNSDPNAPDRWFRIETPSGLDPANAALESPSATKRTNAMHIIEEKAKLEWITPEHLPNSPLCPLHSKYRGPSKGNCIFHRKGKDGDVGGEDAGQGWEGFGGDLDESGHWMKANAKGKSRMKQDGKMMRRESVFDGVEEGPMFVKSRRSRMKSLSSP